MLRFAPHPSGDMSIETLRVAILNYLVAQQRNEGFVVRIEDSNISENMDGKDTEIMQILEKFALKHDTVSHQSENLHIYQTLAIRLLEEDKAFICTCTDMQLEQEKEEAQRNNTPYSYSGRCLHLSNMNHSSLKENGTPFVIRIKTPPHDIVVHDLLRDDISISSEEVDAFIILNEEGKPSDDFAASCADMLMGIDQLIVEEKSLRSSAREIYIQNLLGYQQKIDFVHIPALNNPGNIRTIKSLLEEGFIPDAIINYLLSMGNPHTPREIFTLPDAIEWYNIEDISTSPVAFNIDALRMINKAHLDRMDDKHLSSLFGFADADIGKLAKLYLEEVSTTKELKQKIDTVFAPKDFENRWGKEMRILEKIIMDAPMIDSYEHFEAHLMKESGMDKDQLETPLRILLSGTPEGPELARLYSHIKSYILEVAS